MRTIPFFRASTPLTPAERLAKRHLVFKDTLALLSIFAVTCVLAVLTWLIFRSYSQHQSDAAARWKRRGEEALKHNNAQAAVYDLRTSLGYGPDDPGTEIELAQALAEIGTPRSLEEAAVYLNTLWEKEPGNGNINLQLARVLARQGQVASALEHYHAAVYGVWEGEGAVQGRQARLEMVRYQISLGRFNDARGELLIAAGNDTSTPTLMEVAGLLAEAHAPADALHLYQEVAARRPVVVQALEGAGQMAFLLARYRTARTYLDRALNASNAAHPLTDRALVEKNLRIANAVMAIYPSPELPQRERLRRVVRAYEVARKRYMACANGTSGQSNGPQNGRAQIENNDQMTALGNRWQSERPRLTVAALADSAQLEQATMQLVYDTEQVTERACGEPTGEDEALLRIATSPDSVDQ
ncbi:MAG TPA: tetratricopeptide repeat protein [Acidobacteriaceae bacterium]